MKVFLSSTADDLVEYRKVADDTILRLAQESLLMERFGARPEAPITECERLARESDILICIVAHRYGSIPEDGEASFTQREVEAAHKAGKKVLAWIVADDYKWTDKKEQDLFLDPAVFGNPAREAEVKDRIRKLVAFKAWLRSNVIHDTFTTSDDLGRKIAIGLQQYIPKRGTETIPQDKISIARLPITSSNLFGRETELELLDAAWEDSKITIVSFVAWGGVGKTALVNHWLKQRMARDKYRGAERVYGWSFFSQGTSERAASADLFIDQALRWFGDADPTAGSPWDKGERLANYIRQSRTLLILDGLEPLQHPPGFQEGRLKDAGMQALLVELAADQPGLCVISTRERIGDLVEFENSTVTQHSLEHLSPQAGARILRSLNIKGDEEELEQAAKELDGHAFSLTLLGSYLNEVLDDDIRRRNQIENLFDDTRYGNAAQKMIAAYENWLGEGLELAMLRLLGFFNRPADLASIEVLREQPVILGLTEPLQNFKGRDWIKAAAKLRRIRLLGEASEDEPGTLDAHPLVREYFKQHLKDDRPAAWREGNNRLYEHLKRTAKDFPDTLEEMSPLFDAVAHGCYAGKYRDALENVFQARIQRGRQPFSIKKLGAIGANLTALRNFFISPWHEPVTDLSDRGQAFVLGAAGFCLRSIGRLREAAESFKAAHQRDLGRQDSKNATLDILNLSEVYVAIGDLTRALDFAEQAVTLSDHDQGDQQILSRSILGNTLHQLGRFESALDLFVEAESVQNQLYPRDSILYSHRGFFYCDLLLTLGRVADVKDRVRRTLEIASQNKWLLDIALDNLLLGRAGMLEAEHDGAYAMTEVGKLINQAVGQLREAGDLESLLLGLLARAGFHRKVELYDEAQRDLMEVLRNAKRSEMELYLADYHLEFARLSLSKSDKAEAYKHAEIAKEMINRMGYHRRDKEVAELEAQLA